MLAHTSHLPPASHRLSVLARKSTLITSDIGEQERESGETAEEGNVFWVMWNAKSPLFCFRLDCPLLPQCTLICLTSSSTLSLFL